MLPSATEKKTSIDILLKETDTVWMFVLPGTCKEIEGDEDVQRILKKEPTKKVEKVNPYSENRRNVNRKFRIVRIG